MGRPRKVLAPGELATDDPRHPNNRLVTPAWLLEVARESFGGEIVFDPFSSAIANRVVRAQYYASIDGTAPPADQWPLWTSPATWINPPYGRGLCKPVIAHALTALAADPTPMILLTNFDHSTDWCHALLRCNLLTPVLLWDRVRYLNPDTLAETKGGERPSTIWVSNKCDVRPWAKHGAILERIEYPLT